jgi:ATP-dependent protease ClpP protease subunit
MKMFIKENVATVFIHEEVTPQLAKEITDYIYGLEFLDDVSELLVDINSTGGSVIAGYSIFNAIRNSSKNTTTRISGIAASIAGIIYLSGDSREMMDYALFMMHDPSGGDDSVLAKIKDSLKEILSKDFTGDLDTMMTNETWLNSEEMTQMNVVDTIIGTDESISLTPTNDINELYEICNKLLKNKDSEMEKEQLEETVNETVENVEVQEQEESTENVETVEVEDSVESESEQEVETEVEAEIETEETVSETEEELEAIENNVSEHDDSEDLAKMIEELKAENESLRAELDIQNAKKIEEEKLEILKVSNIESDQYENWLNLDIETIKNLTKTIKVTASAPVVAIQNDVMSIENMTTEEKLAFAQANPKKYAELITKK